MANRYFGVDKGLNQKTSVEESSSTTSKDIEVVIDLTASMSKENVLVGLEAIIEAITEQQWPPA